MDPKQWAKKLTQESDNQAAMWAGHNRDNITNTLNVIAGLVPLLPGRRSGSRIPPTPRIIITAAGIATSLGVARGTIAHNKNLCEPCLADMPLDGPAMAEKKARELRIFHSLYDDRRMSVVLALPSVLGLGVWKIKSRKLSSAAYLALAMPDIYLAHIRRTHFKLEPWCPQCHPHDKDDDREDVPDPVGGVSV